MKSASHPFHHRNRLGLYYEKVLKPILEQSVGESLVKTAEEMDCMDFEGQTTMIELKTRSDQYHYSQPFIQKDGWVLPFCKIERARQEVKKGKKVVFFYFWLAGRSLWRWDFSEEAVQGAKVEYPPWHLDQQKQIFIQAHHWIRAN